MSEKNKGLGPVVVIVIFAAIAVEGVLLTDLLGKTDTLIRAARETEILRVINEMEFAKHYLLQALTYSYYQAAYDLANNGGFQNSQSNSNCIPYWSEYGTLTIPEYETNLKTSVLNYLNKYGTNLKSDVTVPSYSLAEFDRANEILKASANNNLVLQTNTVTIQDDSSFQQKVDFTPILLFDIGKNIANDLNSVSASNYNDALNKIQTIQNKYSNTYGGSNVNILITTQNLGSSNENFAAQTTIILQTPSTYQVSKSNNVGEYPIQLRFYAIFGTQNVAISNACT